jgi:hypothetical protein
MTLMKTSNQTKFAPIFDVLPTQHTIHPMFQPPSLAQEVVDSVVGVTMSSTGFVTFKDLSTLCCAVKTLFYFDSRSFSSPS